MQRDASTHQSRGIPITSTTTTIPHPPSPLPPLDPLDDRRTPSWWTVVWPERYGLEFAARVARPAIRTVRQCRGRLPPGGGPGDHVHVLNGKGSNRRGWWTGRGRGPRPGSRWTTTALPRGGRSCGRNGTDWSLRSGWPSRQSVPFGNVEDAFLQAAGLAIMFTSVSLEYPVDDVGGEKEPYPPPHCSIWPTFSPKTTTEINTVS